MEKQKMIAIKGGGEWNDASVDHIVGPLDLNLENANKEYRKWYEEIYLPTRTAKTQYLDFASWLIKNKKCRYVTENELEIFWEY